jgi:hypothetical protein
VIRELELLDGFESARFLERRSPGVSPDILVTLGSDEFTSTVVHRPFTLSTILAKIRPTSQVCFMFFAFKHF